MFGKKSVVDPKKSAQKFLDQKKDSVARLKHLKSVVGKGILFRQVNMRKSISNPSTGLRTQNVNGYDNFVT